MALIQYTAQVREELLLELPVEAEELHLKPGEKVQVRLDREIEPLPHVQVEKNGGGAEPSGVKGAKKKLGGLGMLEGILNSEEFMRRKHEETEREDRTIWS